MASAVSVAGGLRRAFQGYGWRRLALLCSVSAIALHSVGGASAGQLPASAFQPYVAATASSIQPGPFALYLVPLNSIHPTQMNVGFAEVGKKTAGFDLLAPSALQNNLLTGGSIEPVVIGPGGVIYLTDGHHTFLALTQSIYGASNPSVYVDVIANYSNLTPAQFWAQMQANNLLMPVNDGVTQTVDPLTGAPIPTTLAGMTSDVYRGLEYSILKNKSSVLFPNPSNITGATGSKIPGLDKTAAFYSDFIWADAYRSANGGLGLPYLSPGDIAIATKWNLTGSNQTTLPNVGAVTPAQLPGYILPTNGSIAISGTISNATLANGVLDGSKTGSFDQTTTFASFNGLRGLNLGPVTIGSSAPGFIMQLGADNGSTVTLSGNNTYTGGTTILAGTLIITGDASLGAASPGNAVIDPNNIAASVQAANGITFNSLSEGSGTLQFNSSFTLNRPIAVDGEVANINPNGNTITLTGPIVSLGGGGTGIGNTTGESDLTISGNGTVIVAPASGSNPLFYGNWIISKGTLQASSDAALGNTAGPAFTIGQIDLDGGTFQAAASFSSVRSLIVTSNNTVYDTNGFTTAFTGSLTDVQRLVSINNSSSSNAGAVAFGSFNVGATATLTLSGGAKGETVTFTNGVVRTDRGTLLLQASTAAALGNTEKVLSGSAPTVTNGIVAPWMIIDSGGAAGTNPYDFATYDSTKGYIVATYGATAIGAGTLTARSVVHQTASATLNAANTSYAAYSLKIDNGRTVTIGASNTLTLGDGSNPAGLILSNSSIAGGTLAFGGSEAIIFAKGGSNSISSAISGSNGLTLAGSGTLTVSSASNLTGMINVDSGTLALSAIDVFRVSADGVTLSNNTNNSQSKAILSFTASQTFAALNTVGNNSTISFSGSAALTIGETTNANPLGNNLSSTISATITETGPAVSGATLGALTKNGSGMLDLTGMSKGTLTLVSGSDVVVNGGILRMSGNAFVNPNAIVLNDSSELQLAEGGGTVFANPVSGSGKLHLIGGTLQLKGTNSYTGGTIVEVGSTLDVTAANLPTGGNITNAGGLVVFDQATNGTYSGVMSDGRQMEATTGAFLSGTLVKDDSTGASSGNVTLAAKQTYTGATFVEAGTLTLGVVDAVATSAGVDLGRVGGPLGIGAAPSGGPITATLALAADNMLQGLTSEQGNNTAVLLGGHTLTVNTAAGTAWSFGGSINPTGGAGSLVKSGAGTLMLAGNSFYTGATNINGGILSVNGSIASSSFFVNAGGTLGGNGTVGSTTINAGGTLAPGNSVGTLTVSGSLVFTTASTYLVEVGATADRTNVTGTPGTATLAGTLAAAPQGSTFSFGKSYTVLSAVNGRTGTFDAVTTSNPYISASASYTATDVLLSLSPDLVPSAGGGANQLGVAAALQSGLLALGGMGGFSALFQLPQGSFPVALSQLSGELGTSGTFASQQATGLFLSLLLDPFAEFGGSAAGRSTGPALGYAAESPASSKAAAANAAAYAAVGGRPATAAAFDQSWSAWGAAFGAQSNADGSAAVGSHAVSAHSGSIAGGFDYRVSADTAVGFALAGGSTNFGLSDGLGSGTGDIFQAGAYGTSWLGNYYASAAAALARYELNTTRSVSFPGFADHLTAGFTGYGVGGRVEGGRRFAWADFAVTPYLAVQSLAVHTPSYGEVSSLGVSFAALNYAAETTTHTRSEVGGGVDTRPVNLGAADLRLFARAAWAHEFSRDNSLAATFQSLPGAGFTVQGAAAAADSALLTAAARVKNANGVSLEAKFESVLASGASTYAATGTFRVEW